MAFWFGLATLFSVVNIQNIAFQSSCQSLNKCLSFVRILLLIKSALTFCELRFIFTHNAFEKHYIVTDKVF